MQSGFCIDMLAGMYRVGCPSSVYGMLHLFLGVIVAANEFEAVNNLDWVQHLPDVVPQLGEVSQECLDEVRVTEVGDVG
jgi:hypothetical protein